MESILAEFTNTHPSINKQIYNTYHAHVTNLSRRFFHLLLRYCQYTVFMQGLCESLMHVYTCNMYMYIHRGPPRTSQINHLLL